MIASARGAEPHLVAEASRSMIAAIQHSISRFPVQAAVSQRFRRSSAGNPPDPLLAVDQDYEAPNRVEPVRLLLNSDM
jgi:hypothetical protein